MSHADVPRRRQLIMAIVMIAMMSALGVRLYFLQVLTFEEYELVAHDVGNREVPVAPSRGRILDRYGVVLADNKMVGQVSIDRTLFTLGTEDEDERFEILGNLAAALGVRADELREAYEDSSGEPLLPVVVADDVDEATLTLVRERGTEFPGVQAGLVPVRDYPYESLASHVLGYIGPIPESELELRGDYQATDNFGRAGVELIFEEDLRGEPGTRVFEVDRRSQVIRELDGVAPKKGKDIYLTLDKDLQQFTELALRDGLLSAKKTISDDSGLNYPAPAGTALVMDVQDGSVLAMASFPDYNPNDFIGGIDQDLWDRIRSPSSYRPINNRAIQEVYSPGSVFKLITAIAGLRSGVINRGTEVYDDGTYEIEPCEGKCVFRNAGGNGTGWVNLSRSLTVSSDWYYYNIGARIQIDLERGNDTFIQDTAKEFGFGSDTGIQLPFEQSGFVPGRESREERNAENPIAFPTAGWFPGDNTILAIGQGELNVTPLQMAVAYATFLNRGTRYSPNIVGSVRERTGEVVREIGPRARAQVAIGGEYDDILSGLNGVTRGGGTAAKAFTAYPQSELSVGGKTGTAEVNSDSIVTGLETEDTALFVGYGPTVDPKYVVVIMLEEAGFGGDAAAPVARAIFEKIIELEPRWAAQEAKSVIPETEVVS